MDVDSSQFWIALIQIIGIDIVLSGDNAVVIALATRSLPAKQQRVAIFWGTAAAVLMRVLLAAVALQLLTMPWLKLVGSVLLLWIALKLLQPEFTGEGEAKVGAGMLAAIRAILIADAVMSVDNVIAIAAAARDSILLLVIGLAISIPLVVFTSTLLLRLMSRWPVIIMIGAALLGWVAGEMAITDVTTRDWVDQRAAWMHWVVPATGALLVVVVGKLLAARAQARLAEQPLVDLAHQTQQEKPKP